MNTMFQLAQAFNQDIGDWDVTAVTDMGNMFAGAYDFNQDIGDWDVAKVKSMDNMLTDAKDFNQNLAPWCDADGVLEYQDFKGTKCAKPKCGADGNGDCCCSCR